MTREDTWVIRIQTVHGNEYGVVCSGKYVEGFLAEFEGLTEDQQLCLAGQSPTVDRRPYLCQVKRGDIVGLAAYQL